MRHQLYIQLLFVWEDKKSNVDTNGSQYRLDPTGLLNIRGYNKFSFKHAMEHVMRIPHKCHNFSFSRL